MDLLVCPGGKRAVSQVVSSWLVILRFRRQVSQERVHLDTPSSPGAKWPAAEKEQRAQGDLRDRRRKKKVKSGSRNSSGLPPPPEPGSTLPSAGWSTTCLQGPVCVASSSMRAVYIHVSAEELPIPDEPAATTHLQTEGGDLKKKKKLYTPPQGGQKSVLLSQINIWITAIGTQNTENDTPKNSNIIAMR